MLGRDQAVHGLLRVTMAPIVATHLLMPDLAEFARLHPDVEIDVLSLDEPVNLTNREADVAVRVVYDRNAFPPNLHGLQGPELFGGAYVSRDLLAAWRAGEVERVRWIIQDNIGLAEWAQGGEVPVASVPFRVTSADAQVAAVHLGLGMATLPYFVGDADPLLARVPGGPCGCTARRGCSPRARRARQNWCGCSRSSWPGAWRPTRRCSRDGPAAPTDNCADRHGLPIRRAGRGGAETHNRCEEAWSPARPLAGPRRGPREAGHGFGQY